VVTTALGWFIFGEPIGPWQAVGAGLALTGIVLAQRVPPRDTGRAAREGVPYGPARPMDVHRLDGTYELFRHFYAMPSARDADGREVGAVRGVLNSVLGMINSGSRHVGVATDHVIESFRNRLWHGYKTSAGVDPDLLAQFPLLEDSLTAMGVAVWPMVEFEADDALAAAAVRAAADPRVDRGGSRRTRLCAHRSGIAQLNRCPHHNQ
jgi:hypothetical protein